MPSLQLGYGLQIVGLAAKMPAKKNVISLAFRESALSFSLAAAAIVLSAMIFYSLSLLAGTDASVTEEKAAYLPGQFVSQQLAVSASGYIGK